MLLESKFILAAALVVTLASLVLWQATGGDYYTKYEVVEKIAKPVDPDDPLAQAGFYESDSQVETVTRDEFRFGLLPTPSGILDKHLVSVASVNAMIWGLALLLLWRSRRRSAA